MAEREVRKTRGGWTAEVVWRTPSGGMLVVHNLPPLKSDPGTSYLSVWHSYDGVVSPGIHPHTVDQDFDLLPPACPTCGRKHD
jgi:hypothetical protein